MKNFMKVAEGVDVVPLLMAIHHHPELWCQQEVRQTFENSPHREVEDILLRFSDASDPNIGDQLVCEDTQAMKTLFAARAIVFALMNRVQGTMLGRVMITKLSPGKQIYAHADLLGKYANTYRRFHVPLQSEPGCIFRAGDEQVYMKPGEVWDFNAHAMHHIVNNSADDRIHLIVDIRTS